MSYSLTEKAEADLESILLYIAERESVGRALHVLDQFTENFESLAAMPGMGTVKADLTGERVRWWWVFKYGVVYDPGSPEITVMRIVHGSQDLGRLFEDWWDGR